MELFSPGHLIPLLIVAALLFFGWKQLPDMARSVGRSLRIFKTEMKGMTEDDKARAQAAAAEPPAVAPPAPPPAPPAVVLPPAQPAEQPAPPPNSAATTEPPAQPSSQDASGQSHLRAR